MCEGVEAVPGLRVVECVERVVRCPYREAWVSGRSKGKTAREHAEWFVPTTKTWSNSTFKAALRSGSLQPRLTSTYLGALGVNGTVAL